MLKRLRESEFSDRVEDIRGATLYGSNSDKIGTIDDVIYDSDSYTARYAIVDTGGLFKTRRFLIPADYLRSAASDPDAFYTDLTKDYVENLPEFDENVLGAQQRFSEYDDRYRSKWQSYGFNLPSSRHPRITRFENRLRTATPVSTSATRPVGAGASTPLSVFGVYGDREKLEAAVQKLKDEGFRSEDISVVFPDEGRTQRFALEHNTKGPEGATVGGGTGIVAGGVLGWLAGIGTLAIPGIGPLLAAGPIATALAGAGFGGAVGGLAGGLIGLGMPELEAKRYEKEIREGRMLVSVRCNDPRYIPSARSVLESTGAKDIFQAGEKLAA
jgi:PRC-barrel domain/Alternative complex III, ActD subunit